MQTDKEFREDVQWQYERYLDSIYLHWKRGWINDDEMYHRRSINRAWFHLVYAHLNPWNEVYRDQLSPELIAKYDNQPNFPLCSIIFYHNEEIPVYDDDYGQQVFARWHDHEWSGGAYNLMYADQFCDELDNALEHQMWDQFEAKYNKPTED